MRTIRQQDNVELKKLLPIAILPFFV